MSRANLVEIIAEDGEVEATCTILEFIDANMEGLSDEEIEAVSDLEIGGHVDVGGGAAPFLTVVRIS